MVYDKEKLDVLSYEYAPYGTPSYDALMRPEFTASQNSL
jgi:hypothetical protein